MANMTRTSEAVTVVRGEEEVFRRTAHLFETAGEITCAANALATFGWREAAGTLSATHPPNPGARVRKVYRSSMLLDPSWDRRLAVIRGHSGVDVRITTQEVNETIILDGRVVILGGDLRAGERTYSIITERGAVQGVNSLFEATWRAATELDVYDAEVAEIRVLAPQVLDLLAQGVKDETAARELGLGVRTYRRRVAELMAALGADSRFQAGVRARELGLV
ncbi:DNA-binding response regulator [Myceligenerans crystallogenes]|uniref:Response regulator transcription factor n=1 Tax=Myceligenerans crystallogenes TaxID=316335 RepID=A0ABN2NCV3_9MICO